MDKLKLAHDYLLKIMSNSPLVDQVDIEFAVSTAWSYARMMHSEKIKEDKTDSEQKRKEVREILNDANTFIEREGQHFDDVADVCETYSSSEWRPDWSQAPDGYNYWVATADHSGKISGGWFYDVKPEIGKSDGVSTYYSSNSNAVLTESFSYQGNWQNSLRKRPNDP